MLRKLGKTTSQTCSHFFQPLAALPNSHQLLSVDIWAAAGFKDTQLRIAHPLLRLEIVREKGNQRHIAQVGSLWIQDLPRALRPPRVPPLCAVSHIKRKPEIAVQSEGVMPKQSIRRPTLSFRWRGHGTVFSGVGITPGYCARNNSVSPSSSTSPLNATKASNSAPDLLIVR